MAIGNDFLKNLFSEPSQQEEELDPIETLRIKLAEAGYDNNDYNVEKLLESNPDGELNDLRNVTLNEDPVKVNGVGDFVKNSLVGTPVFQFLRGAAGPLSVIAEGFKRYESAKTSALQSVLTGGSPVNAGLEIAKSIAGKSKTQYPDANLRMGDYPELGDLFRSLGLPESVSSTLGVALDLADPVFLFGGAVAKGVVSATKPAVSQFLKEVPEFERFANPLIKGYKLASGKISEGADKIIKSKYADFLRDFNIKSVEDLSKLADTNANAAMEFVKSKWATLRSNQLVSDTIDGLAGRGSLWKFAQPLKETLRKFNGAEQRAQFDADSMATRITLSANGDAAILKNVDDILHGRGGSLEALPKDLQFEVQKARDLVDAESADLARILDEIGGSGKTADVIRENIGEYMTRQYKVFADNAAWKNDPVKFEKAASELVDSGEFASHAKAKEYLTNLVTDAKPKPSTVSGGQKLDPSIFKKRNEFGPAVRDYLDEITDPAANLRNTVQKIAQAKHNLRMFKAFKDAGLIVDNATTTHSTKLLNDSRLFLGKGANMYTTKDVDTFLSHVFNQQNALDSMTRKTFQWLKAVKTIGNLKTHVHNSLGNITFAILDGVTPFERPKLYQEMFQMWHDVRQYKANKLPAEHPSVQQWRELIERGVIGNEMPNADQLRNMTEFIANPYSFKGVQKAFRVAVKEATDLYAFEDQLFKGASYLHKTRELKMTPEAALEKIYQSFPNYREAAHIADTARNSTFGLMALNPFLTFQFEAHRILLNAMKDPIKAAKLAAIMGSRLAYNSAILAAAGNGLKDIWEYVASDPKVASDYLLNPLNKDTGFNLKYTDPFNSSGMFAPFLAAAGATGQNPFDYLLDMTAFSNDFGYSNLLVSALAPALSGKGRYGETLSGGDRANEVVKAVLPSSVGSDLPKILDNANSPSDRLVSTFRMFGIDLEKRNPEYVKRKFSARFKDNIQQGRDTSGTVKIANMLGFDGDRMLKTALTNAKKAAKPVKKEEKKASPHEALFKQLGI